MTSKKFDIGEKIYHWWDNLPPEVKCITFKTLVGNFPLVENFPTRGKFYTNYFPDSRINISKHFIFTDTGLKTTNSITIRGGGCKLCGPLAPHKCLHVLGLSPFLLKIFSF